ncbi:MAG: haloacid dehalogenase type II [Burkholderiales bacterium]
MAQASQSILQVIAFDVFGTVVDWHAGIASEVKRLAPEVDGCEFALAWREGYKPAMERVMDDIREGQGGFIKIDLLHRQILDGMLARFGLEGLNEDQRRHLNLAWHRLPAWPDSVAGLSRLKKKFTVCTLSNGNIALLADMAKNAGLPWDCILSAEVFRAYKPDPRTYLGVADVFGVPAAQVMLAAAHHEDLAAARDSGLQTAYIERPLEFGAAKPKDVSPKAGNTLHAKDISDLAAQLGA